MRRVHIIALILVTALSFWLRLWGAFDAKCYINDEIIIIPGMENYFASGTFFPDGWEQPPFNYHLLRWSTALFGSGPVAWRIKNILLGGLAVPVIYLLARDLLKNRTMALFAALMMAIEPMHIMFSRTANAEVPATTFFLLAILCVIRFKKGELQTLLPAGIFLGLAHAQKWYFLIPSLVLLLHVVAADRRETGRSRLLLLGYGTTMLVLVPFAIYALPYYQWLERGYNLKEFILMQFDSYRELQAQDIQTFINPFIQSSISSPREWFIKPMYFVTKTASSGIFGRYSGFTANIPLWLLTLPAFFLLAYVAYSKKQSNLVMIIALFCTSYFQFSAVNRPVILYSALVVIPYAYLALSYLLVTFADRTRLPTMTLGIIAALLTTAGLYFYPLGTELSVPAVLYDYLVTFHGF